MNLLPLLPKLTKQDRDIIWFVAWQLRPDARPILANYLLEANGWKTRKREGGGS